MRLALPYVMNRRHLPIKQIEKTMANINGMLQRELGAQLR